MSVWTYLVAGAWAEAASNATKLSRKLSTEVYHSPFLLRGGLTKYLTGKLILLHLINNGRLEIGYYFHSLIRNDIIKGKNAREGCNALCNLMYTIFHLAFILFLMPHL